MRLEKMIFYKIDLSVIDIYALTSKKWKCKFLSHVQLCDPMNLCMEFSRPEYWSG